MKRKNPYARRGETGSCAAVWASHGKRRGTLWYMVLCILLGLLSAGCSRQDETKILEEGQYYTYYVNSSGTALVSRIYEPESTDTEGMIAEFIVQCQTGPADGDGRRAIPGNVVMSESAKLQDRIVHLYFDTTYTTMDKVTELLCKAALAKTITQLEEVDYICIYVNGEVYKGNPALNTNTGGEVDLPGVDDTLESMEETGNGMGPGESNTPPGLIPAATTEKTLWCGADFLDNTGDDTNKYLQAELILYFANAEGKALEAEVRQVVYSSTLSMERVVLNQLIEGPQNDGLTATLPENLKIQGVSLRDGVCYVDFDSTFLEEPVKVTDQVEIYSIVNSLTELGNVLQVQITVNGSADAVLRNNISLSGRFEKDPGLIAVPDESMEETTSDQTPITTEPTTQPAMESTTDSALEQTQEESMQQ